MVPDMENSRRSFDRPRDPSLIKKPRLAEEPVRPPHPGGRPFPNQRQIGLAGGPVSRIRGAIRETEIDDPSREAYQPQPINPHHELVNQYKAALSELTFNSKPIITNLTIIAGENLHAAKAVATTICTNILEVPCEQKLPSLYLLDSIVKNIGREYIKFFAPRLPEVFCKAYRQVDPSTHSSMRHLFGTWKGVFPPQTLQMIEKELGFASKVDGSSSGLTSRVDPRTQRPPHSIHVNPKYLEQQRLQQPLRQGKGVVNDVSGVMTGSTGDVDRPERSSLPAGRPWISPSVKLNSIQHSQRDALIDSLHEKNIGEAYREYEYGSDLRDSAFGARKIGGRIADQSRDKPSVGTGGNFSDIAVSRDGSNVEQRISGYANTRSGSANMHLQAGQMDANKVSGGISSWKNSEEEEFMWEKHSRLSESDVANLSSSSKHESWTPVDPENLDSGNTLLRPPSLRDPISNFDPEAPTDVFDSERRNHFAYGRLTPSQPAEGGLLRSGSVNNAVSSKSHSAAVGRFLHTNVTSNLSSKGIRPRIGSTGSVGQQQYQSLSRGSSMRQRQSSPPLRVHHSRQLRFPEQDYEDPLSKHDFRVSQFSVKSDDLYSEVSLPTLPLDPQFTDLQTLDPEDLGADTPTSGLSNSLAADVSEQSSTSSLLAAVMKSDFLSNIIGTGMDYRGLENKGKPTSGPLTPVVASKASLGPSSHDSISAQPKVEHPPLASGMPSSSLTVATSAELDSKNNASNPISNLLNSLVSKGLISASKSESLPAMPQQKSPHTSLPAVPQQKSPHVSLPAVPQQKSPHVSLPAVPQQKSPPPVPQQKSPPAVPQQKSPPAVPQQKSPPAVQQWQLAPAVQQQKLSPAVIQRQSPSAVQQRRSPPAVQQQKWSPAVIQRQSPSAVQQRRSPPAVLQNSNPTALQRKPAPTVPQWKPALTVVQRKSAPTVPQQDPVLVERGSAPAMPQQKSPAAVQGPVLPESKSQTPDDPTKSTALVASVAGSSCNQPVCTMEKVSSAAAAKESTPALSTSVEIEDLIGFQLKPDVIRKFHPSVISSLFEDLPHQCSLCGLHLKHTEQLDKHLERHAKEKLESDMLDKEPRGWFMTADDWVSGMPGPQTSGSIGSLGELGRIADGEPMVPADEDQCACILCGELFEDFFCQERDEWMFKRAVHMPIPLDGADVTTMDDGSSGLLVHEHCLTESSMHELGFTARVKQETDG